MKVLISSAFIWAIAINASSVYAEVRTIKDSQGNAIIRGLAPNSVVELKYAPKNIAEQLTSNSCGILVIPKKYNGDLGVTEGFKIFSPNGSNEAIYNFSIIANAGTIALPECFNGVITPVTYNPEEFKKTSDGRFIIGNLPPNSPYIVQTGIDNIRKVKANACGIVRLKSTVAYPVTGNILVDNNPNNSFSAENLPIEAPPICRSGIEFVPTETNGANRLVRRNSKNDLIFGGTPNTVVPMTVRDAIIKRTIVGDSCGMVRARNTTRTPFPDATIYLKDSSGNEVANSVGAYQVQGNPKCLNGQVTVVEFGNTQVYGNNGYSTLRFNQDLYFLNLTPTTAYSLEYPALLSKDIKINACGIGRVKSSVRFPIAGEITIDGTGYSLDSFPPDETKAVCRGSVFYAPKQ